MAESKEVQNEREIWGALGSSKRWFEGVGSVGVIREGDGERKEAMWGRSEGEREKGRVEGV